MRILRTGHAIADTVADALYGGPDFDGVIGYGILRGTAEVFRKSKHYFELDRGYFHPGHYDGYYRISHRGTQQCADWPEPDYERLRALKLQFQPWRGFAPEKPVLVCPPTEAVAEFFNLQYWEHGLDLGTEDTEELQRRYIIRQKGDTSPINFSEYSYVLTFNSSVGWQALLAGIPCASDNTNSIVGAYFNNLALDDLAEAQYLDRERLFATMSALQFTLDEIRGGKAWNLIQKIIGQSK